MKVYENVFIGNFLYALGFSICSKSGAKSIPSMVSLLQQTPVDKPLGDVLLEFPGTLRLIEFKRKGNPSKKEIDKHRLISQGVNDERLKESNIIEVSRAIHWFVEFDAITDPDRLAVCAIPYIDAFPDSSVDSNGSLELLIESIANDACNDTCNDQAKYGQEILRGYLKTVISLEKNILNKPNAGAGGILLSASSTTGVQFVQFEDILDLQLQHKQVVNSFTKEVRGQPQRASDLSRDRTFEDEMDRGHSR